MIDKDIIMTEAAFFCRNRTICLFDKEEILSFISEFAKAREPFMTGCCYWFAWILQERFCGGEILYDYK